MKSLTLLLLISATHAQQTFQSPLTSPLYDASFVRQHIPRTVSRNQRVAGGQVATLGQVPYQALLYTTPEDAPAATYLCGASIISPKAVLTAGHCLFGMQNATVFVGVIDRVSGPFEWRASVEKDAFVVHPRFNEDELTNDIALLHTPEIPLSANVAVIALPTAEDASLASLTGRKGVISGWSSTRSPVRQLQVATVSVALGGKCALYFGLLSYRHTNVCVSTLYAGSPCSGDSGGPLVVSIDDRDVLVGVVSYGSVWGCDVGAPVVFTRVSSYLAWIKQNIEL